MRKPVKQLLALLLLLIFAEKAGLRLWLHDYLHTNAVLQAAEKNDHHSTKIIAVSCDCLDDFAIPMTETEVSALPLPVIQTHIPLEIYYNSPLYVTQIYSGLLRAPPVLFV